MNRYLRMQDVPFSRLGHAPEDSAYYVATRGRSFKRLENTISLTSYIKRPEVAARLKPFRIKPPRKIGTPLKVESKTKRYDLIGMAFDYLLRFELQRRAPHANVEPLVAEKVPGMLWSERPGVAGGLDLFHDRRMSPDCTPEEVVSYMPQEVARRARVIVDNAKRAIAAYLKNSNTSQAMLAELAGHAIRLANLDPVYRALRLSPDFEKVDPQDVEDLLAILAVTPFEELMHERVLLLNSTFGESSKIVGGADTDLISGDNLIELKTIKGPDYKPEYLDQLFGYLLLARNERRRDPTFPKINRLSLYFCRYAHFLHLNVADLTSNAGFSELETWFIDHAKEVFAKRRPEGGRSTRG